MSKEVEIIALLEQQNTLLERLFITTNMHLATVGCFMSYKMAELDSETLEKVADIYSKEFEKVINKESQKCQNSKQPTT